MSGALAEVWPVVLALARVLPIALITPLFGGRWLASGVRISLVTCLAGTCLASAAGADLSEFHTSAPEPSRIVEAHPQALLAIAFEVARGTFLGFAVALSFAGLRAGFSLAFAPAFTPAWASLSGSRPATPAAGWATLFGVAIFFAIDGHHGVLRALASTFRHWPPGALPGQVAPAFGEFEDAARAIESARLADQLILDSARVLTTAVTIAAPLLIAQVAAGVTLGLWQRVHRLLVSSALLDGVMGLVRAAVSALAVLAMSAVAARVISELPATLARAIG